nr:endo alpha-1,4 polygalactosaminidase [Kibdelosporangium sp. MJ126-NF4]CEL14107.1 DNA for SgaA, complete cds [Kibdelosporangium sp. MJ126-NF4]CTQ88474.1 DNA for SgaA, complete cds [Kibdelosporangium sp. MJ126-NF4]
MRNWGKHVLVIAAALCASAAPVTAASAALPAVELPPPGGQFDYQIGGPYTPDASVKVVSRDREQAPVPGKYNVCYLNAMQTQPDPGADEDPPNPRPNPELVGTTAWYLKYHKDVVLHKDGKPVMDGEWGEAVLDVTTSAKRKALLEVQKPWIDGCRTSGFQAIEPDNLDSYDRSGGAFKFAQNRDYMVLFNGYAKEKGLAVAQKNVNSEYGNTGPSVGFSFAIAEECAVYDECAEYRTPYGDRYYEVEYTDNPRSAFTKECTKNGKTTSIILRDRNVVPKGHKDYHYELCANRPRS